MPLAIALGLSTRVIPPRLLAAGVVACLLPDIDVIAFRFDVPYGSALAHRGFTHSIVFALLCGAAAAWRAPRLHSHRRMAFLFVFAAAASHGVLDAFTTGGSGIAFFWPFDHERYFMPLQMILVSPIGTHFFSARGIAVLWSELQWVWLPCTLLALTIYLIRYSFGRASRAEGNT